MKHEEDAVHILLVKNGQIMQLFFIREEIPDGMELFGFPAHLRNDKKLRNKAFREKKACFCVRVNAGKLFHETADICIFGKCRGPLQQTFCGVPVGEVGPGELDQEALILTGDIFLTQIFKILPVGFMSFKKLIERGKTGHLVVLRIPQPEHFQPVKRLCVVRFVMNDRVHGRLLEMFDKIRPLPRTTCAKSQR